MIVMQCQDSAACQPAIVEVHEIATCKDQVPKEEIVKIVSMPCPAAPPKPCSATHTSSPVVPPAVPAAVPPTVQPIVHPVAHPTVHPAPQPSLPAMVAESPCHTSAPCNEMVKMVEKPCSTMMAMPCPKTQDICPPVDIAAPSVSTS